MRRILIQRPAHLGTVARGRNPEAFLLEVFLDERPNVRVVINHKHVRQLIHNEKIQ
jgi:hypothetical protein